MRVHQCTTHMRVHASVCAVDAPAWFDWLVGVIGALASVLAVAMASTDTYGEAGIIKLFGVDAASDFDAGAQAMKQLLALVVTLAFALVGGFLTGLVCKLPICNPVTESEMLFSDEAHWEAREPFRVSSSHACRKMCIILFVYGPIPTCCV